MNMTIVWVAAAILFAVVEAFSVQLVSIWFSAGSLAAMLTAALGGALWLQIVLFCLVSLVVLLLARPVAKKYLIPKKTATNADRVIGMVGLVTQLIDPLMETGQVSVAGNVWTARTEGEPIPEGEKVRVLRIEGVKLFVEPIAQTAVQAPKV